MSKKTLNSKNLEALGAECLAELLLEVSIGSAAIKRRLRLEISHNLGPLELAREVRKRLASLRKSKSFVGWRRRKALVKDLSMQNDMITKKIAVQDPIIAFELLWEFMDLAPSVYSRVDDNCVEVDQVFRNALMQLGDIGPHVELDLSLLTAKILDSLINNDFGVFDDLIGLLAPTLGSEGLCLLKEKVLDYSQTSSKRGSKEHATLEFLRDLRSEKLSYQRNYQDELVRVCLQEIARAQGEIDEYISYYSEEDLVRPYIAEKIAKLLLAANRAEDALTILNGTNHGEQIHGNVEWDMLYIACLTELGRFYDAQDHRRRRFEQTLTPIFLRDYLNGLPDFEDIEAEDAAKKQVQKYENVHNALSFFLDWPDLAAAAHLIKSRATELSGEFEEMFALAADTLQEKHPLAAIVLRRTIIEKILKDRNFSRYTIVANHLMDCVALDLDIVDYGSLEPHQSYFLRLRKEYQLKGPQWDRVD
ncbi:MAG: hypothetical protein HOJ51_15420 [Tateyamaria sp.]|nr:hypothetical protein [Tateyamaria sp.]